MTALSVQPPFPIITGLDGQPLEDGYIWIGVANLQPIGNPIAVYWDAALTIPAPLPIRTQGGYPVNSGTPARLYVGSDYSIQVQDKNGSVAYTSLSVTERLGDISSAFVTFIQAGSGAVVRTAQSKMRDIVNAKDFGAVGNGIADDTAAVQAAVNAAVATDKTLVIDSSYKILLPIVMPNGLVISWQGGEIIWATFGYPAFYNLSAGDTIQSVGAMKFRWEGTIPTGGAPAISTAFVAALYGAGLTGNFNNCRDNIGGLLLCGTNFTHEGPASFVATTFTNVTTACPLGFAVTQGIGGYAGKVAFDDLFFDGCLMGFQGFNGYSLSVGDIRSERWGQLDLNVYSHSLPGHLFYIAPDITPFNVFQVGDCFDAGIALSGTDYTWGSTSYKTTGAPLWFNAGVLSSRRAAGLANIHAGGGVITGLRWDGRAATWSNYSANRIITLGAVGTSGPSVNQAVRLWVGFLNIDAPSDDLGGNFFAGGQGVYIASGCYRGDNASYGSSTLGSIAGNNHVVNMDFYLPNMPYNSFCVPITIVAGSNNNRIRTTFSGPDWQNCRFVENGGASDSGNTIALTHSESGSTREMADNVEILRVVDNAVATLTGASVTVTSGLSPGSAMFPKGCMVQGVTSRIETTITGASGYELGDGSVTTRYANKTGTTAVGSQSGAVDLGSGALTQITANTNIVVTALGSNFTGGTLRIRAVYQTVIAGLYNF
jgi:hypothetical protein